LVTLLNIVVVEDHDSFRESIVETLSAQGHLVVGVDCAEALPELDNIHMDLMIIDLNLPGEDGVSLARRMRVAQPGIGIVMLTARMRLIDKVTGYENGADIYLTKPISLDELSAAIQSLARRIKSAYIVSSTLSLDTLHLRLIGPLSAINLTKQESMLLSAFVLAQDRKLETWQLIQVLGKSEEDYHKSALELIIVRLRKKMIEAGSSPKPIQAIREFGYQLCEHVQLL
jgi:DNA-binding response OmpR family regulator